MSDPTAFHWASSLDQEDPTLSDLADAVGQLGIPLTACREVLSKVGDGEIDDPPQLIALVALMEEVQRKRERLWSYLHRLAESEEPKVVPFSR